MRTPEEILHPVAPTQFRAEYTGWSFADAEVRLRRVYDWMIKRLQFAVEDRVAAMDSLSEADIRAAIDGAEQAGAVRRT